MNYFKIDKCDTGNGPGIRVSLWVSGCSHKCNKCQNPETWNPENGKPFTDVCKRELFEACKSPYIQGLTISGGDPFFISNRENVERLVKEFKENFPQKNIWIWTGFKYEDLLNFQIAKNILFYTDVLVDGKFDSEQRKIDLKNMNAPEILAFRGSSNQRIIDVQKSLKNSQIYLYDPETKIIN